ncbi:MAG: hypothetical protein KBA46_06385 [Candidatus Omnitrophica bacterium]|nr:hypothetical protein [Candidatus Omnitrophota bacterium]
MFKSAKLGKEIVVTVANKIGVLADMTKILADSGINMMAVAGFVTGGEAKIMLVAADNLRAIDALRKRNYSAIKENEVVIVEVEDKAGALRNIAVKLAGESIDIKHIYGTNCGCGGPVMIVFSTTDNERAVVALMAR